MIESARQLRTAGAIVKHEIVVIDRNEGARAKLAANQIALRALFSLEEAPRIRATKKCATPSCPARSEMPRRCLALADVALRGSIAAARPVQSRGIAHAARSRPATASGYASRVLASEVASE